MQESSTVHVKTNWSRYDDCPRCGVAAGTPCVDIASFIRMRKQFEREQPHRERSTA